MISNGFYMAMAWTNTDQRPMERASCSGFKARHTQRARCSSPGYIFVDACWRLLTNGRCRCALHLQRLGGAE